MNSRTGMTALLTLLLLMTTGALAAGAFLSTPGGVLYKDLKPGSGNIAAAGDVATMHYTGWLDADGSKGKELYSSRRLGGPVSFVVGTDYVMPGWNEGVTGMQPGGKRLLRIPPSHGYGARGVQNLVPPDASLIFVIELVDVEKRTAP